MKFKKYISYNEWIKEDVRRDRSKLTSKQHEFFNILDNEKSVYWLGFLCADGYISIKEGRVVLSLEQTDREHLQKFANIFKKELKLSIAKKNEKESYMYRCSIRSRYMVNNLAEVKGLDNHKTFTLSEKIFEHIPKQLQHHFIRGYFDGDGHIGKFGENNNFNIISTKSFLIRVQKILIENCGLYETRLEIRENCFRINYCNVPSILSIRDWLYKDATIYLERKKERFFEYKAREKSSKYRGVSLKKNSDKWDSRIRINGAQKIIGLFKTEIEAAKAYDEEAKKAGYPKYKINFPDV